MNANFNSAKCLTFTSKPKTQKNHRSFLLVCACLLVFLFSAPARCCPLLLFIVLCTSTITPQPTFIIMIGKSLMRRYNAPSLGRSFCSTQRPFRVLGLQQVAIGGLDKPVSLCVNVYVADCFRGQFNFFVFNIHRFFVFRL